MPAFLVLGISTLLSGSKLQSFWGMSFEPDTLFSFILYALVFFLFANLTAEKNADQNAERTLKSAAINNVLKIFLASSGILAEEKIVESPKTKRNTKTAKVSFDQTKLNFPELIIFTIHKIRMKKTNTERSICFDKAIGKIVPGKKKRGNKNTNKYKLYLMILLRMFSIVLILPSKLLIDNRSGHWTKITSAFF